MNKIQSHNMTNATHGEDIGRLLLRDMAAVYKNSRGGRQRVLSPQEKAELVGSLVEPQDIAKYNEFRYVHEYLARAVASFMLEESSANNYFHQLSRILECLKLAEQENTHALENLPRLMTAKEFEESFGLFPPSAESDYGKGVAIVDQNNFPAHTYPLDKKGHYKLQSPPWRREFMAENILKNKEDIEQLLFLYKHSLKECLVIKNAIDLMADFLNLPEISSLVDDIDINQLEQLNKLMRSTPKVIRRKNISPDEQTEKELIESIKNILKTINPEQLKPSVACLKKARKAIDFSVAQGRAEEFYDILRGGVK